MNRELSFARAVQNREGAGERRERQRGSCITKHSEKRRLEQIHGQKAHVLIEDVPVGSRQPVEPLND